jgi:hypothetical protein
MDKVLAKRLVVDKKVDVQEVGSPVETVFISGTNKSLYRYTADSYSAASIIFNNITPPSLNTVVKRCLPVQIQMYVTTVWDIRYGGGQFNAVASVPITAYAGGGNLVAGQIVPLYGINDGNVRAVAPNASLCLRANPLAQMLSTADIRINGTSTTCSFNDYALLYQYLNDHENVAQWSSEFPLQRENSPVYENVSNRSPFAKLSQNPFEPSRASFVAQLVQSATAGNNCTNVYLVQWTEQLPISPFLTGKDQENVGLTNINNLTLNLRIDNLINGFSSLSGVAGTAFTVAPTITPAFTATIGGGQANAGQPTLLMEFITQNSIVASMQPAMCVYDYQQLQPYIAPGGLSPTTIPATINTSISGTSTSLRLVAIPQTLYIYARPAKGQYNSSIPDMFLTPLQVKVLFNNRVNLLVDYTPAQLYQLSVKNGLKQSWSEWSYGVGSPLVINVAEDLGLSESEQAGQGNSYCTLQVIATFSNQNLVANGYAGGVVFDYYVTTVTPGKAYVSKSECDFSISSAPNPAEVLAITADSDKLLHEDLPSAEGQDGGSFSHLLKRGLSVVRSGLSKIKPEHLSMAADVLGGLGGGVAGAGMAKHRRGK